MLNGRWRWDVSADARLTDDSSVRIEAASVLARNAVLHGALGWTWETPIIWVLGIVTAAATAIFSDGVKNWLRALLGRGAGTTTGAGAPSAGDQQQ
jgi:hypothetical protein